VVGDGGKVVTFEVDPRHAEVAKTNIAREGVSARVDLRVGPALEMLPLLESEAPEPFDLAFIDADKPSNAAYFAYALKLSRRGALIIVDNVVREGTVADPSSADGGALGARALFEAVAAEKRVEATAVQTVGAKGWDGFLIARVKLPASRASQALSNAPFAPRRFRRRGAPSAPNMAASTWLPRSS
jgi:predicted O-methyltransferase YrrM